MMHSQKNIKLSITSLRHTHQYMSDLGRAIAKMISCKLLIPEDQVCCQAAHVEFVVDKGERTGTIYLQLLQFFPRWKWTMAHSQLQLNRDTVSPHHKNNIMCDYEVYHLLG